MGKRKLFLILTGALISACVHKVELEPSDKPFIVNLNVKIDHEVRHKIEDENQDLIGLENEAAKPKVGTKSGGKKK